MKEKVFLLKFMELLKAKSNHKMWYFKSHGEPMQVRGIPDVLVCYCGMFVAIEFKIMRSGILSITPYQEFNLKCISESNGISLTIWWDEDSGEVGIGAKRSKTINDAVDWLIDKLVATLKIAPIEKSTIAVLSS
jgi:hypothetical protein